MEIIVKGRNIDVTDRFRGHVEDKLQKIEQFAPRAQRVDVELTHEPNPAQAETSERIEITIRDKGPVIRAEAAASDSYGALDLAMGKLIERLRRVRDRKKEHPSKARVATPLTLTPDDVNIPQEKPHKEEKKLPRLRARPWRPSLVIRQWWYVRSFMRQLRCRSTRLFMRWNWSVILSTCSLTKRRSSRVRFTTGTDGLTA